MDAVAKRKNSLLCPCRESNPGWPDRSIMSVLTKLLKEPG